MQEFVLAGDLSRRSLKPDIFDAPGISWNSRTILRLAKMFLLALAVFSSCAILLSSDETRRYVSVGGGALYSNLDGRRLEGAPGPREPADYGARFRGAGDHVLDVEMMLRNMGVLKTVGKGTSSITDPRGNRRRGTWAKILQLKHGSSMNAGEHGDPLLRGGAQDPEIAALLENLGVRVDNVTGEPLRLATTGHAWLPIRRTVERMSGWRRYVRWDRFELSLERLARRDCHDEEHSEELLRVVSSRKSSEGVIVLAFADKGYRDTALNWIASLEAVGVTNYVLVCLDAESHVFYQQVGVPSVRLPEPSACADISAADASVTRISEQQREVRLSIVWLRRIMIVSRLLNAGIDVVLSDVDAVWVSNALSFLEGGSREIRSPVLNSSYGKSNERSDGDSGELPLIVASRGQWPQGCAQKWGATLCMGWIALKAQHPVTCLLDKVKSHGYAQYVRFFATAQMIKETLEANGITGDAAFRRVLYQGYCDARQGILNNPCKWFDDQSAANEMLCLVPPHAPYGVDVIWSEQGEIVHKTGYVDRVKNGVAGGVVTHGEAMLRGLNCAGRTADARLPIALLPHSTVPRRCDVSPITGKKVADRVQARETYPDAAVFHCHLAQKVGADKNTALKEQGLWILPEDLPRSKGAYSAEAWRTILNLKRS